MTEKQSKAIERCRELIKESHSCWIGITNQEAIRIVLSMIENQQERIDYLMRSIERKEQSLIEKHEENIEYYTMIEKKDKIIEQMTYYIMNLDIDEDICKKVNCDTNSGELDCKDCIKQYFENKVNT